MTTGQLTDEDNFRELEELRLIKHCRLCQGSSFQTVFDLGTTAFTGVFPSSAHEDIGGGPLRLVMCGACGLVQLADSFALDVLYGESYGYRSGLNASMSEHLAHTATRLASRSGLQPGDVVLDIGANDGSLLQAYHTSGIVRVAIDPTINKFHEFYEKDAICIPDFFSAEQFDRVSSRRAKIVTSIAMFYDLEDPVTFARDVHHVLSDDGLWHFEQSYMPWMLRSGAYDTVCHEHLEYYSLTNIMQVLDMAGFTLIDVATTDINGGSIAVTAAKKGSGLASECMLAHWLLNQEKLDRVHELVSWQRFAEGVSRRQSDLFDLLVRIRDDGKTVAGLGASTKGNVVLQTSGIGRDLLGVVGDVNPDKFGRFLPGTYIPITSEKAVLEQSPDFLLVLPWHFRNSFMSNLSPYLANGGRLIFPLPNIEVTGY